MFKYYRSHTYVYIYSKMRIVPIPSKVYVLS